MRDVPFAILLAAEARATWPSYLVFALLAIGIVAVVWQNQRARRRAQPHRDRDPDQP
jgi:hypothetical protein